MEPNGSPLGPEILPKSRKSQTKALEALITKNSEKQLEKVSLQTPPFPLKSSKIIGGWIKNRRSSNCLFLDFGCPPWPFFGSFFSNVGHKSSTRTVERHCEKNPKNSHAIISLFTEKGSNKQQLFGHGNLVFLRPRNKFEKSDIVSQKWCPNGIQLVPKTPWNPKKL